MRRFRLQWPCFAYSRGHGLYVIYSNFNIITSVQITFSCTCKQTRLYNTCYMVVAEVTSLNVEATVQAPNIHSFTVLCCLKTTYFRTRAATPLDFLGNLGVAETKMLQRQRILFIVFFSFQCLSALRYMYVLERSITTFCNVSKL